MIICDGHVHIHHCHSIDALLSAAIGNFSRFSKKHREPDDHFDYVLWLTESSGIDYFDQLYGRAMNAETPSRSATMNSEWLFYRTEEPNSLVARNGSQSVFLIAGRQIVTKENLEILALGAKQPFSEQMLFPEALGSVLNEGALAVIPWGFGKWLGKRGAVVKNHLIRKSGLFLGDNGGRPALSNPPKLFQLAKQAGIGILPGSDPLPFKKEYLRVGSYGWIAPYRLPKAFPATELIRFHKANDVDIALYGNRMPFLSFLKLQFLMQAKKRIGI